MPTETNHVRTKARIPPTSNVARRRKIVKAEMCRKTPHLRKSREPIVVGLVSADPEPMEVVAFAVRNGTVRTANVRCPNLILLLERQRRMKRLRLEQCKLCVGQHPDICRQRLIALPKLRQGKRLETHQ